MYEYSESWIEPGFNYYSLGCPDCYDRGVDLQIARTLSDQGPAAERAPKLWFGASDSSRPIDQDVFCKPNHLYPQNKKHRRRFYASGPSELLTAAHMMASRINASPPRSTAARTLSAQNNIRTSTVLYHHAAASPALPLPNPLSQLLHLHLHHVAPSKDPQSP